jgi:hypothetical protein
MNKLAIVTATVLSAACGGAPSEHPLTATCTPSVNVTIAKAPVVKKTSVAPIRERRSEVVQVYWDISRSMREFARKSDDLTPVVGALDSNVLLQAHAESVEQYGVGESIVPLPSARSALSPTANRTVLHLAAEQIGTALASGSAQAALVVSDLELDTPPRTSRTATVCGGVPLPSTPEAGSLFGRCFESAVLATDRPALTRTNLLAHVFRKASHGRELFILLLATDRDFGYRISDEIVRRIGFERSVIFDSGAVAAGNVRGCRLSVPAEGMLRTNEGCAVKCFDPDASIQAECDLRPSAGKAWIVPVGREQSTVRFIIPCTAPAGIFEEDIAYSWRIGTPWSQPAAGALAQKATVRDLFESLANAIVRVVAPRTLRIGIRLAK